MRCCDVQICVQDSETYLKALQLGDAWVAVGWSSDILSFLKRNSYIAAAVPQDGTLLFADLWVSPRRTSSCFSSVAHFKCNTCMAKRCHGAAWLGSKGAWHPSLWQLPYCLRMPWVFRVFLM